MERYAPTPGKVVTRVPVKMASLAETARRNWMNASLHLAAMERNVWYVAKLQNTFEGC